MLYELKHKLEGLGNYLYSNLRGVAFATVLTLAGLQCGPRIINSIPTPQPTNTPTPTIIVKRTPIPTTNLQLPSPTPEDISKSLPINTVTPGPTSTPTATSTPTPALDTQPPIISDLSWSPTDVKNDKVYVGTISFKAEDPSGIAEAELLFNGVVYPMERVSGVERDRFLAEIEDIQGGQRYPYTVRVVDGAGNESEASGRTPYIREFENIAPLDDILIGAHYFPWYTRDSWIRNGKQTTIHIPLLGQYTSEDARIFDRHIDWATGHGIDFFIIEWADPNNWTSENFENNILRNSELIRAGQIKFSMTYDLDVSSELGRLTKTNDGKGNNWFNYGFDMRDGHNRSIFFEDFRYLSNFFDHPQYIKVDGKPLLFIYGAMKLRDAEDIIKEIRGRYNPFLVSQLVANYPGGEIERRIVPLYPLFDGVYAFNMVGGNPGIGDSHIGFVSQQYDIFERYARQFNVHFVPHTEPGYNDSAIREPYLIVERTPEFFRKYSQMSLGYLDPTLRMILVSTYNEWNEDSQVEPGNYEEGPFAYLQVIRDYIAGK